MNVSGSVILVTGAASGIGRAAALRFAAEGATIVAVDRDAEGLAALDLAAQHVRVPCNVASEDAVAALGEELKSRELLPHVVVNNAAVLKDQTLVSRLGRRIKRHSLADWQETLDTNLTGTFLVAREMASLWIELKLPGLIVNTSSVVRCGNAGQSAYSATKAGVDALTVTWSRELAPYRIRVAAIAHGFAETGMTQRIPPLFLEQLRRRATLGRFGEVDELTQGIRFIIENDYFAGRTLELDGGMRF
jgi:3-oxoacyl-[acyl-carrier protein] reductase